jgi:phytanoyl-CoA dioxygenase PhyH
MTWSPTAAHATYTQPWRIAVFAGSRSYKGGRGSRATRFGDMDDIDVTHFRAFGFVALRGVFEAGPLREELDRALGEGVFSRFGADVGTGQVRGEYVPMMSARTSHSLSLLDRFEASAAVLLGGPVLPVRAKGMRYFGGTPWHRDSPLDLASVGFAAYLEPLQADSGALRVLPGSHRHDFGGAVQAYLAALGADSPALALPGFPIVTEPGDVIAFDEHLFHASTGGTTRRQWRVDYFRDPTSAAEEEVVRRYFAGIFPPDWDGGYDVETFPSYGPDWRGSGRLAAHRLGELGAYEFAAVQEKFARSRRSRC